MTRAVRYVISIKYIAYLTARFLREHRFSTDMMSLGTGDNPTDESDIYIFVVKPDDTKELQIQAFCDFLIATDIRYPPSI